MVAIAVVLAAPAAAQERLDFDAPAHEAAFALPEFTARQITGWLATLDARLEKAATPRDAAGVLDALARRLQQGILPAALEQSAIAHLLQWKTRKPEFAGAVDAATTLIARFTVGKRAPEIVGVDLSGQPLQLSQYRGKVVVLTFSGEWCGICRSEYPYQRFLAELYENWPFEMLSVESGRDPAVAKATKANHGLSHRSWWDPGGKAQFGPIAAAWQVTGWPTTYILDADGIIRFVDLRKEDLLKAVRHLVGAAADAQSSR